MKIKIQYIYIILIHLCFSQFGQNILQYEKFDWKYIQTKYFDIYFYDDGLENRDFISIESEKAYKKIANHLNWELKDRYTIILHNSHNDFQQTNAINVYMQEGIGGVTELYKNRIVIPFDGSLNEFKHVLHHEMVHLFINDMLYGGSIRNMMYSNVKPIPLWMNEGLAEYLATKWNTNSEMWLRDIALNGGDFPDFNQLNGYLAYRGGHSIWRFITTKWGDEVIAEIFWELKKVSTIDKALKNILGADLNDLIDMWHKDLKKTYWPEIQVRDNISDISETLIDHTELNNSYNIAPFISPTGEKFTIYSNKSGNMGIYLVSTLDGSFIKNVIEGEQTTKFEELHILKPGVSWSPSGERIVFSTKSGESDALYILNIENNNLQEMRFDIEGIFQPVWNPIESSNEILFIGNDGKQSDIYIYNYETQDLLNLTNDWFSEEDPSWSIDGEKIYFISNRDNYNFTNSNFNINESYPSLNISNKDIYKIHKNNRKIIRITNTSWTESYPIELNNQNGIIYLSDQSGINNIYIKKGEEVYPLTNVSTGITQFSIDYNNNQILFCGLENLGYNIYSITDPIRLIDKKINVPKADWKNKNLAYYEISRNKNEEIINGTIYKNNYENFVFKDMDSSKVSDIINKPEKIIHYDNTIYNYDKPRFTLDFMQATFGYDLTYNNTQGMAQILLSDMMGDHKIFINTEMEVDFQNSDYMFEYHLLPNRIDWFFRVYHYAYLFDNNFDFFADRRVENLGFNIISKYPFNRFERLEASINLNHTIETAFILNNGYFSEQYDGSSNIFQSAIKYVWDNSRWRGLHPAEGTRLYLKYRFAPKHDNYTDTNDNDFGCITLDFRNYDKFEISSLAFRLFAGKYIGDSPYKFKLGGGPWIASSQSRPQYEYNSYTQYFNEYVYPVRGTNLGARLGSNVLLINLEYRLPMLMYYLPSIKWLGQINGVFFTDIGVAWNENIPGFNNSIYWENESESDSEGWSWTYGIGPRFVFLGMPWQLDYTWQYFPLTGKNQYNGWYLTIGFDF